MDFTLQGEYLDVKENLDCTAACNTVFEEIAVIKLIIKKDNVLSMPSIKIWQCNAALQYIIFSI